MIKTHNSGFRTLAIMRFIMERLTGFFSNRVFTQFPYLIGIEIPINFSE